MPKRIPKSHRRWPYQSAKPMLLMMLQARARFNDPGRAYPGTDCPFCERANAQEDLVLSGFGEKPEWWGNECSRCCPVGWHMHRSGVERHRLRDVCTRYGGRWFKTWAEWLEMGE